MQKTILIFTLAAAASLFTGCGTSDTAKSTYGSSETNVLGLYKSEKASYSSTGINTFDMCSDEVSPRANYSGDKTTLLWGLITLKDY
ncbi:MAG: hypothetical protein CBC33_005680 [Coraliomargarita sp. TMED73]|nr:MAG: hypothetical protein CBC33_005680 [Coraliomargarita sp. TMED73]|tara:strand:+ start:2067 stop:2327 length:261 start_codon:yes stop_codon:yes gene_type:complete